MTRERFVVQCILQVFMIHGPWDYDSGAYGPESALSLGFDTGKGFRTALDSSLCPGTKLTINISHGPQVHQKV